MSDRRIDLTDDAALAESTGRTLEDLALRDDYALNPAYVAWVVDAADRDDPERLRELLDALHPADVADLMGFLSAEYREQLLPIIDPNELPDILSELDTNIREEVLEDVSPATLARVLEELDSDDAADVLDDLDEDRRGAVLAAMSDVDRAAIETSLAYEDETAGRLMQREVMAAPMFWTVAQAMEHVRAAADDLPDLFFDVYVVDPSFRPVGAVPLSTLLKARMDAQLEQVMEAVTEIDVGMDQEEIAYIFQKYHLISAPVTDQGGRLVGQITVDDIVGVISEESQEDILALAGVSDAGRDADVMEVARSRMGWLVVNVFTALLASSVISLFQNQIAALVSLAVLMPIVASMGGNAGTQTLAVAVRALATRELTAANALRIVGREATVGVINGGTFALIMAAVAFFWFHQPLLSLVIGLAMVVNLIAASLAGILVPLTLNRLGYDPAVSSSVFVTTVTDVVGFFTFLGLAALILL
jgi:magnesium transporter